MLGSWGTASASLAGSNEAGEIGGQASLALEVGVPLITAFGRVQRTAGEYHDVASASADDRDSGGRLLTSSRPPRELIQAGVSFGLPFDPIRISLNYARREAVDGDEHNTASLSLSRRIAEGVYFHANAVAVLGNDEHYGAFASISFPLGGERRGAAGARYDVDGPTAYAEASRPGSREPGEIGWRAGAEIGADSGVYAAASYRTPAAHLRASVDYELTASRATAEADGAIVFAGGDFFLTHRIDDAFAVVDVGAPEIDVFYENRPVGTTGRDGRMIVPDLRALQENRISIDPTGLPVDVVVPSAERIVSPMPRAGVKVDFEMASTASAAVVAFRDQAGHPIDLGSSVRLAGGEDASFVGYDGEAYLQGLSDRNEAVITTPGGTVCRATFDFMPKRGAQVRIDAVPCVPE